MASLPGNKMISQFAQEVLDLEEHIEATMIALLIYRGLQDAINYAYSEYTRYVGETRKVLTRGFKSIVFYSEPADIFIGCLKTYDLGFVSFVQLFANFKPRLTSTLLDIFAECSSQYEKQFKINHFLADYKNAIICYILYLMPPDMQLDENSVDLLIDYAETYGQLETIYHFLRKGEISLPRLCIKIAKYLEMLNRKWEAAKMYEEAKEFEKALTLYSDICKWEEARSIIDTMNISKDEKEQKLYHLASRLEEAGAFLRAATLYSDSHSYEKSIFCFVRAHSFYKAAELARAAIPSMKEYIKTELCSYTEYLQDMFFTSIGNMQCLTKRLETIWNERIEEIQNDIEKVIQTYRYIKLLVDEPYFFYDFRRGRPYEDVGIIRIVHDKITEMSQLKNEMDDVVSTLLDYDERKKGMHIESLYYEMMDVFKDCIIKIWLPGLNKPSLDIVVAARMNIQALEYHYILPPVLPDVGHQGV